jgi:diguanylate cyclase (GGDEF)-like protein
MLRRLLRRYGAFRLAMGVSAAAVVVSVILTTALSYLFDSEGPGPMGLALGIAVPLLIGPPFSLAQLRLLDHLDQAEARLRVLSVTDDLTGAANRRRFIDLAEREVARVRRYGGEFAIALLDIDGFKRLNDTCGHLGGDRVLRALSEVCRANIRAMDTLARYGGEEFIVLFPATGAAAAAEIAERLRQRLAELRLDFPPHWLQFTVSVGVAECDEGVHDLDELFQRADNALYAAKRAGGDQVEVWDESNQVFGVANGAQDTDRLDL